MVKSKHAKGSRAPSPTEEPPKEGPCAAPALLFTTDTDPSRCCLDPSARPPCRPRYLRRDSASTPAPVGTQPSPSEVAESRTTACQRLNPEGNPPDCRLDGEVQARQGVACPFSNGGATEGRALCCTRPAVHHRH
ncbi:uncharacterized protein [Penaeus vannamei]|uniref:uncharacterized protein n=1 Tax=Penaeus vannamei TaxID=6689 RepID=UPI00387F48E7